MKILYLSLFVVFCTMLISCSTCTQHRAFAEKVLERPDDFEMLFKNSIYYDSTFQIEYGGVDFRKSIKIHNRNKDYTYFETRNNSYESIRDSIPVTVNICAIIFSSSEDKGFFFFVFKNKFNRWNITTIDWRPTLFPLTGDSKR